MVYAEFKVGAFLKNKTDRLRHARASTFLFWLHTGGELLKTTTKLWYVSKLDLFFFETNAVMH